MTKKLVTDALQSPSLVGELRQYHKQQIQLNAKRGLLVILSVIFLLLQYIAIDYPINGSNTSNIHSDAIYGGVNSKQDILLNYDDESSVLRRNTEALSISRSELASMSETTTADWPPTKSPLVVAWSQVPVYKLSSESIEQKPTTNFVAMSANNRYAYFGHNIKTSDLKTSNYTILAGHSAAAGDFAILKDSGNFLTTNNSADTCFKNPDKTISYGVCPNSNTFEANITAHNLNYKTEAKFIKNHPGDRIEYTLSMHNKDQTVITVTPKLYMGDILEYAQLSHVEDAMYNRQSDTLVWPSVSLEPNQTKDLVFSVQLLGDIPVNASSSTNTTSYDCYMSSFFGSENSIKTSCPTPKILERMVSTPSQPYILKISWLIFIVSLILYIKSYVFTKEREIMLRNMRKKHD